MKDSKIEIRIESFKKEVLKEIAKDKHVSVSFLIESLINDLIKKEKF